MRKWLRNVLIAIDQLGNALTGGDPDETISSRIGKIANKHRTDVCILCRWIAVSLCWVLDRIDENHCADAIEKDEGWWKNN